jgi:FAD/FMN-containing dehydrogenase
MLPRMSLAATHIDAFAGIVMTPGDRGWDAARQAFNLTVDQRPAVIAVPVHDADVAAALRFARERGLRVAPQRTGHGAAPLGPLGDTLLLKTDELEGMQIDAAGRRARVRAGAKWADVVPRASALGLAALHGSSPDLGVVGYALGGGIGWYARAHGLACNSVTAIDLVTADGELVHATHDEESDLFWAARGGGGNFGIVTRLELELYRVSTGYAGALFFPWDRSGEVLHTWRELLPDLPDEITSVGRIMQFPPFEEIPEPLRGGRFVVVEAVHLGDAADGEELLRPLRELGPELDTFATMPPAGITRLHMDPPHPVPALTASLLLGDLAVSAIDELVAVTGPRSGSPLLSVELRHLGGALARTAPHHGALSRLRGSFAMVAVGMTRDPASAAAIESQLALVTRALRAHHAGLAWNFVEEPTDASRFFDEETYRRLRAIKAHYDPEERFQANHSIPGSTEPGIGL